MTHYPGTACHLSLRRGKNAHKEERCRQSRLRGRVKYKGVNKMDCLFCKIIDGEIPSNKVYEDDMMLAFRDINPQAPEHIVIVPKCHIASANEINAENVKYVAAIWEKIPQIASELGFAENGYRVVNNCGEDGGQTVPHLHFHLMGGKKFTDL